MKLFRFLFIIICLVMLIICTSCGTDDEHIKMALIDNATKYEISDVNAAIIEEDKIQWTSKYGSNSKDDSIYCIGSISKSFVAVLALLLEQEGKICLDDTIGNYLTNPALQNKSTVTLKELFTMRSGIDDYTTSFDKEDYFNDYTEDELINIGVSHSALIKREDFNYSNTNILIAQQMIEKATGSSCELLIKEKILVPLGLTNTFFADEKNTILDKIIPGYSNTNTDNNVDFTDTTTSWSGFACGMYSTAADMVKWGNFLMNSTLISDNSRKELFAFNDTEKGFNYGLCIMQKEINGQYVTVLQGNVPGYSSAIYIFDNTILSVLCNLSDYCGKKMSYAEEIAKAIMMESRL